MEAKEKHAILKAISVLTAKVERLEIDTLRQHTEKMVVMTEIQAQVKHTNGRVTALERKMDKQDAIEEYKSKMLSQPTTVSVATTTTWDWKTVLAIILTLATAAAGVAGVAAK